MLRFATELTRTIGYSKLITASKLFGARASMDYEGFNQFCQSLPASTHVVQWGGSDVWKVGGKVFAIGGWSQSKRPAFTFKTSELDFEFLRERDGYRPAPYMASRGMKWIQQYDCDEDDALRYYIKESYRLVSLGLSKKKQKELGLIDNSTQP